jgi:hypothetical protein
MANTQRNFDGSLVDTLLDEQKSLLLVCKYMKEQTDANEAYARQVQAEDEARVQVAEKGVWDWLWQWVGSKIHLSW